MSNAAEITEKNCTPILPPGELIGTVSNGKIHDGNPIKPSWQTGTKPLDPLTFVERIENSNEIALYTTVLINSKDKINKLNIYGDNSSADGIPNIYISYDFSEKTPNSIIPHTFRINLPVLQGSTSWPNQIRVYLWDEDPTTSRGTVTNVLD